MDSADNLDSASPIEITRITPSGGDVPAGRQIVLQFNQPVVSEDRMESGPSEIPVAIEPALDCQWRWINPSTLSCRLDENNAMAPATRYTITVHPGFTSEEGASLDQEVVHTFITERPKVSSTWFKTWVSPGEPLIGVLFNQPVREESAVEHLYFESSSGDRIAAVVSEDPQYAESTDYRKGVLWLVKPREELPPDSPVSLQVESGILSQAGPEPGVEERPITSFSTFPPFRFLGIECQDSSRETITIHPDEPLHMQHKCNPSGTIFLLFSAPVLKEDVERGLNVSPGGPGEQADYDPWADVYSDSRLSEPHHKGETYSLSLPESFIKPDTEYRLEARSESIRDEFGRPLQGGLYMDFGTGRNEVE